MKYRGHHHYTREQDGWIRDHIREVEGFDDLAIAFNQAFGAEVTTEALRSRCSKVLSICLGGNKSRYKAGHRLKAVPIGTVRRTQTGTYIKVSDTCTNMSGYQKPDWLPLQQKIYEDAHGKLPEGMMVCFLDRDRENFELENLYPIDRATAAILAKNKWWSTDADITRTGIVWFDLKKAIKEVRQ